MTTTHVMIDLETLGTSHDAVILSIGAVKFDPNTIDLIAEDSFYCGVDPVSCQELGLKIEARTVLWWLDPERAESRKALLDDSLVDLPSVLDGFASWYGVDSLPTWSNGANFDIPIMQHAFKAIGREAPWRFYDEWCYRTLKGLKQSMPMEQRGIGHHALDDATAQAFHVKMLVNALGIVL